MHAHSGIRRRAETEQINRARIGNEKARGDGDGGGLARAVGPKKAEDFTRGDVERDAVNRSGGTEGFADGAKGEHGRGEELVA